MEDITELLERLKASPYEEVPVVAPHTGVVRFIAPAIGSSVLGTTGTWGECLGTPIATLTREHNEKIISAPQDGEMTDIRSALDGSFVEAGTRLASIRHFLNKDEVIGKILRHALFLFKAPERAKYLFVSSIDAKIKASGCRMVSVWHGMELFIMSRMKRETPVYYIGPAGVIYDVYFRHDDNIDVGSPLIGVCPKEQAPTIEEIVLRIRTEWKTAR